MFDAVVVGGGAAGLMAAITAAERGKHVLLLEKNAQLGRKIRITGKGRCNVTNNCEPRTVIESTPGNGRFLYGAVNHFTPQDTMDFFEGLGVPLKTERGNRVFPVSDNAHDIADALWKKLKKCRVEIRQGNVKEVLTENGSVIGVRTENDVFEAPNVLLACGGASYPGTGSNGDGARLAEKLGHTIIPMRPSLVALTSDDEDCPAMQGLSLRNCGVTVTDNEKKKKPVYTDFGELLFTHFGLSGPTILSASAHMRHMASGRYTVTLDLKPALTPEQLDQRLLRDLEKNKNRNFSNSLDEPGCRAAVGHSAGREVQHHHARAACGAFGCLKALYGGDFRLCTAFRRNCDGGRRFRKGSRPEDDAVQINSGLVLCGGNSGRGRVHGRL